MIYLLSKFDKDSGGARGKMLIVQNIKYDLSTLKFHLVYVIRPF